ncbi:hypothetical protein KSF_087780 [Reticulibacter mediterranei]|uniref:Uncharacterized protein n=1 Tax=Reticulibacter mediterranei TaxID=2778369 RepID=A0A8J3IXR5_9CHLR|nr:hypothetical protein KSF_087780 [Reticulibacter mediterranei]
MHIIMQFPNILVLLQIWIARTYHNLPFQLRIWLMQNGSVFIQKDTDHYLNLGKSVEVGYVWILLIGC